MSSCYKLTMPNGYKKEIYYDKDSDKATLIKEQVLKYWEDYCLSHWLWQNKFEQGKMNYEDKTKSLLDRCATFLLQSDFYNGKILDYRKVNKIYKKEIPLSCTPDDIQDIVYGINTECDNITQTPVRSSSTVNNDILLKNHQEHVCIHKSRLTKIKKRYKSSQHYKIKKIYSQPDKTIRMLYKLKNSDLQGKPTNKELPADELVKWQQRPFKNVHGENIYEYRPKAIKGHTGIIDPSSPYVWEWCYVDTCNEFKFNGSRYVIDSLVTQYQGRPDNVRKKEPETVYDMDKILCYEQNGKKYYFDQEINPIKGSCIKQLL